MTQQSSRRTKGPRLCRHKRSGNAYAKFNGQQVWFGPWDDPRSHEEFHRFKAAWIANGCRLPEPDRERKTYSVAELADAYEEHVKVYYRKDGTPTTEVSVQMVAVGHLRDLYGHTSVTDFGPLALKACRDAMVANELSRTTVNGYVSRIRQCFRWGVENELVPAVVYHALTAVRGLRRGRSTARETEPVRPVTEKQMRAVLPHVAREVAAMIQLQWLTGMRPNEVVRMRGRDLDRSGAVWLYRPERHKLEHHGIERIIAIGPKARTVLEPFLKLDPREYLFSPERAENERNRERRGNRKFPPWPSHDPELRRRRRGRPRKLTDRYATDTYRRAVARGCDLAGIDGWSPNQLRHAAATRIRRELGLEAAQAVLGHRFVETTQVYAEISRGRAEDAMAKLG